MKQETIELGGYEYICTALPARVGVRVASKLANALAPAIKSLPEDGDVDALALASMIEPLLRNPDLGDVVDYLIGVFAERTIVVNAGQADVNGNAKQQPLARVFDTQFEDSYDDMIRWLLFSVRLSLSSFFRGVQGLGVLAAMGKKSASTSQPSAATIGSAGVS